MPVSPFRETPARNLMYKIPTEQFVFVHSTYTADIAVEEQQNYPEIVPSVWSVELTIAEKDGKAVVTATVRPKEGVKNTSTMLVECTVRIGVPCKIAPYTRKDCGTPSLESLTTAVYGSCGKNHYRLKQNTHVFVNLFFYPEKLTGESSKDRLDLQRLRESPTLSDCKLVCANEEFPVHRAILAAQSPVFAAMFKNEMLEQSSGVCQIDGISADVLEIMIDYAYTRAPFEASNLTELWHTADKYDMEDLRAECVRRMASSITTENVLQYFNLAREHGLTKLKIAAGQFIGQDPLNIP